MRVKTVPDFQRMTDDPQPLDPDRLRRMIDRHNVCVRRFNRLPEDRRRMTTMHPLESHLKDEEYRDRHDDYG
jgi:hypothetical protein